MSFIVLLPEIDKRASFQKEGKIVDPSNFEQILMRPSLDKGSSQHEIRIRKPIHMSEGVGKIPRPSDYYLRGPYGNRFRFYGVLSLVLPFGVAYAYKHFVVDWRRNKYEEFWRTYDAERDFQRMVNAGVFKSVRPKWEKRKEPKFLADYRPEVEKVIGDLK
ncbi:hypothetical protein ACOME3_006798 [Neoechinorhynchus agilis]